ncbi:MAG TPA: type II secretion system F family protein [Actinomycetota bacterium]|nr:type II secretion system F family protein [Actinomycetota bacterium]
MSSVSMNPDLTGEAAGVSVTVGLLLLSVLWMFRQGSSTSRDPHRHRVLGQLGESRRATSDEVSRSAPRILVARGRIVVFAVCLAVTLGISSWHLAGPVAGVVAATGGAWLPIAKNRRTKRKRGERLDEQFAEYVEAAAMAVRGGLSIRHAMEFAAEEAEEPMAPLLHRVLNDQRLGSSFDRTLDRLAEELPTNETRLLVLVLRVHSRSGGNLADSLDVVASSIRQRMDSRRELHVLSAQGRMSGSILAVLPLVFFVVLAASSRSDMSPVLRSPAGIVLVSAGLTLQGLGYLWIKSLLRVRL